MVKPREWPNHAKSARDRAAEELQQAERMLRPLVEGIQFDQTETLRRQAMALRCILIALRHLENAGAQTRPE